VSFWTWIDGADRAVGDALSRRAWPAARAAAASAIIGLLLRCLETSACVSESFHRRHVRGARARYLFRTEDGALASHLVIDGSELSAGSGSAGCLADGDWDLVIVFRDPASIASLLLSTNPDVVLALVRRQVRVAGNLALLYKLGFMLSDLGARTGLRPRGVQ
jgi:hypothetical protein